MTSIIVQRVTTRPRLSLPFVVYNSACILPQSGLRSGRGVRVACARWAWRACGGRGVRAVGVACARWAWRARGGRGDINIFFP